MQTHTVTPPTLLFDYVAIFTIFCPLSITTTISNDITSPPDTNTNTYTLLNVLFFSFLSLSLLFFLLYFSTRRCFVFNCDCTTQLSSSQPSISLSLFSFSPPFSPSLALPGPSIVTKRSIFANPVAFMAAEKVSILLSTPNHFPLQTL